MMCMSECECVADIAGDCQPLRVVFASLDGDKVDQHFGSAQALYVYAIDESKATLLAVKHFGYEQNDGNEDKLKPKLSWLVGSDVVYCGSIGASATKQLVNLGITPIRVTGEPDVNALIAGIQVELQKEPEFWLANILKKKVRLSAGADRFDVDAGEDWE